MPPMGHFRKTAGFTLVEMILVIAILATLSSAAIVGYTSFVKKASHVAVQTFLDNLKKQILIANAEAGDIDTIEVYPMGDKTLFIKVKAACFSRNFAEHIQALFPDAVDIAPDDITAVTAYSFFVSAPPDWDQSAYADVRKLVYSRLTDVWEIQN